MIHETAIVSPKATLCVDVEVGPFAIIEEDVEIGQGTTIGSHAILRNGTRLGEKVTIDSHAIVAGLPQDLGFDKNVVSYVTVGDGTTVREGCTLNRATKPGGSTVIGSKCYFMAYAHVGHDAVVGNNVILGNNCLLAGHSHVAAFTFMGGGSGIHQFNRIGRGAMIGGLSPVTLDVPPFCMVADRNDLVGFNLIGLKRRGHTREAIRSLKFAFSEVYRREGNIKKIAQELLLLEETQTEEAQEFLKFFLESKRGVTRPRGGKSS